MISEECLRLSSDVSHIQPCTHVCPHITPKQQGKFCEAWHPGKGVASWRINQNPHLWTLSLASDLRFFLGIKEATISPGVEHRAKKTYSAKSRETSTPGEPCFGDRKQNATFKGLCIMLSSPCPVTSRKTYVILGTRRGGHTISWHSFSSSPFQANHQVRLSYWLLKPKVAQSVLIHQSGHWNGA